MGFCGEGRRNKFDWAELPDTQPQNRRQTNEIPPYTLRFMQHLGTLGNYDKSELGEGATPRKEIDASHFPIRHILISFSRGSLSPPFYAPLTPSPHNGTLG